MSRLKEKDSDIQFPQVSVFSQIVSLARARFHITKNVLFDFRRDSISKTIIVLIGLGVVLTIGYVASYESFHFIERFPSFGSDLNAKLLAILFLVLFTLVAISTAIVAYTSLYLAKETEYFFQLPIPPSVVFFFKTIEAIFFSAWATAILCLPVLMAYGRLKGAPFLYYIEALVTLLVFLFFCGFAGAMFTALILGLVKRWTIKKATIAGFALLVFFTWLLITNFDFVNFNQGNEVAALNRFATNIKSLQTPYFPSTWAMEGIFAATSGQHREYFFNLGLILANTLILIPILKIYADRWYGTRWLFVRSPLKKKKVSPDPSRVQGGEYRIRKIWHKTKPRKVLNTKDIFSFLRSPSQVSQFMFFLVLTVVYILSLSQIPQENFPRYYKLLLFYANIGAICLILSSFASRFIFPLISLEGRSFWIIGLAPIPKNSLVKQKASYGRLLLMSLGVIAAVGSSLCLRYEMKTLASSVFLTLLGSWMLTSLAVGFGTAYPNFNEDNPARIAVGLGGTLNFFASALSVVLLLAVEAVPYFLQSRPSWIVILTSHFAALVLTLSISHLSIRAGERALEKMEF